MTVSVQNRTAVLLENPPEPPQIAPVVVVAVAVVSLNARVHVFLSRRFRSRRIHRRSRQMRGDAYGCRYCGEEEHLSHGFWKSVSDRWLLWMSFTTRTRNASNIIFSASQSHKKRIDSTEERARSNTTLNTVESHATMSLAVNRHESGAIMVWVWGGMAQCYDRRARECAEKREVDERKSFLRSLVNGAEQFGRALLGNHGVDRERWREWHWYWTIVCIQACW